MKFSTMTSKERITAALEGRDLDYVPFCPFLAYVWEYFPKDVQDAGQPVFHQRIGADPIWRGASCAVSWRSPKSIEWVSKEIDGLVYAEVRTPVGTLRYTQANSDTGRTCFLIEHPLKTEEDYKIQLWIEENGTMEPDYSPTQYDQFIRPEIEQWCAVLKSANKKYIQHACGHMKAILLKLHAQGTFAVESLSPLPTGNIGLKEARPIVGDKVGIIGGIEPTHFLKLSERELGPYVEQVLEDGAGGPFVLANSDSCPPGVTVEKFKRVAEVARAAGSGGEKSQ